MFLKWDNERKNLTVTRFQISFYKISHYVCVEIIAFILSSCLQNSLDPRIITMTDQGRPQDCDAFSRL